MIKTHHSKESRVKPVILPFGENAVDSGGESDGRPRFDFDSAWRRKTVVINCFMLVPGFGLT
jgi:hypothetical protein